MAIVCVKGAHCADRMVARAKRWGLHFAYHWKGPSFKGVARDLYVVVPDGFDFFGTPGKAKEMLRMKNN